MDYYSQNYAGILGSALTMEAKKGNLRTRTMQIYACSIIVSWWNIH